MTDKPTVRICAPPNRVAERRYVFDVVFSEWLGLDYELESHDEPRTTVQLVGDLRSSRITFPDVLFGAPREDWLKVPSLPVRPLAHLMLDPLLPSTSCAAAGQLTSRSSHTSIPVLYGVPAPCGRAWHAAEAGAEFHVDIFGSVFYLLTLYEEAVLPDRDKHGRFPSSASIAVVEGFSDRPLVDEYIDSLWASISYVWPKLKRRPSTFRLHLTHDVDEPWAARRRRAMLGDLILRHDPSLAGRRLRAIWDAQFGRFDRDPFDTFDLLMDVSERHGLTSVFYFQAGSSAGDFDFRYDISDRRLASVLRRIDARGHEVSLHASYLSFRSSDQIRDEFDALSRACRAVGFDRALGVRQHYLRFENPVTWRSQNRAGLAYDSTVGWADRVGFRAGTCREYPVFDLLERGQMRLRERPLLVMDGALRSEGAHDLDNAGSQARAVVDECRRHGGDAVLLFHNHTLGRSRHRPFYCDLVAELAPDPPKP